MKSYFDAVIKREETNSVKWNSKFYKSRFNENTDLLPLWVADMDFRVSPGISRRLQEIIDHGILGYTSRDEEYFEAIIRWNEIRHGWKLRKEDIFYTPGVVPAINYIIQAFTKEGDGILIQPPVYYPFQRSIDTNRRVTVKNSLIERKNGYYEIDFEDMEKKIAENKVKMFILCSPHNPVGRVWKQEELKRISEICLKHNVLIISDEIHSDLIFNGNTHIPLPLISTEAAANTIVCNAVSKTFNLAGVKVSNVIITNPELKKVFQAKLDELSIGEPNSFAIAAVKGAYLDSDEWFQEMLQYIQENIDYTAEYLKENLPEIKFYKSEGTYLAWIDFRNYELVYEEMQEIFEKEIKVAIDYGNWFGEEGDGFIRLNLACPRAILKEALERLRKYFAQKKIKL